MLQMTNVGHSVEHSQNVGQNAIVYVLFGFKAIRRVSHSGSECLITYRKQCDQQVKVAWRRRPKKLLL